jgi:uncharacterized oxidoreductase
LVARLVTGLFFTTGLFCTPSSKVKRDASMLFQNSSIVITGGGSGIGLALAQRLQQAGNSVIVCGRREARLQEAARELPGLHTFPCDLALEEERVRLFEFIVSKHPSTNILINNAAIQSRPGPLTSDQDWKAHLREIATNLEAPMHLSMLFTKHLMRKEEAAIINVTSGLAFVPMSFMATYCATKAALHSFTLSLRHQLSGTSIRVIEIIPPKVNTDLGGVGLHDDGVPLDRFADSVVVGLQDGRTEFGYESSERNRLASREQLDLLFSILNPR